MNYYDFLWWIKFWLIKTAVALKMPLSLLISVNRTAKVNRLPLSPPLESTMDVFKTMQLAKSERKKRRLIRERQKKEKQASQSKEIAPFSTSWVNYGCVQSIQLTKSEWRKSKLIRERQQKKVDERGLWVTAQRIDMVIWKESNQVFFSSLGYNFSKVLSIMVQVTKLKNSLLKYCLLWAIVCLFVRNDVVYFNAVAFALSGIHMFTHKHHGGSYHCRLRDQIWDPPRFIKNSWKMHF